MIQSRIEGWAFLVGRGRTEGYRTLLAPDFLIADRQFGILAQKVVGDVPPEGPPKLARAALPGGELTIVFRTLRVTEGLLESMVANSGEGSAEPDALVTDQEGRPLDLSFGFATFATLDARPDERDLDMAREQALASYRRFIVGEAAYTIEPSRAFTLRAPSPPKPESRPVPAAGGYPGPPVSRGPVSHPQQPARGDVGADRPAIPASAGIAVVVVLLVVMAVVFVLSQGGDDGDVAAAAMVGVGAPKCAAAVADGTRTCSITVRSTGSADLRLSDLAIEPAPAEKPARATWAVAEGCRDPIPPGDRCVIKVSAEPVAGNRGSASGVLTFRTNQPGEPTIDQSIKVSLAAATRK